MKDAVEPKETWFQGREVVVGHLDDDLNSLAFEQCAVPVEEVPTSATRLKGKQRALYELIEQEGPVGRDTLRGLAMEERSDGPAFASTNQFRSALKQLVDKQFVVENDGRIMTYDRYFA